MQEAYTRIFIQLCVFGVLYIIYSYYTLKCINNNFIKRIGNIRVDKLLLLLLIILVVIDNRGGDYYSYMNMFNSGGKNIYEDDDWIEPIYFFLFKIIPNYNYIFRLILWGGGVFVFKLACGRLDLNLVAAYTLFGIFYVGDYSYARASIGIIIAFFAYSYWLTMDRKHKVNYLKFITLFILSVSLHKSIIGLWFIIFIAQFLTFNKQTIFILLLLYYPLTLFLNANIIPIIYKISGSLGLFGKSAEQYIFAGAQGNNFYNACIFRLPQLILLFISYFFFIRSLSKLPNNVKKMAITSFFIFYCSMLISSLSMGNSETVAVRYMLMSIPFGIVCCTFYLTHFKIKKIIILIIYLWAILHLLAYLYYSLSHEDDIMYRVYRYLDLPIVR